MKTFIPQVTAAVIGAVTGLLAGQHVGNTWLADAAIKPAYLAAAAAQTSKTTTTGASSGLSIFGSAVFERQAALLALEIYAALNRATVDRCEQGSGNCWALNIASPMRHVGED